MFGVADALDRLINGRGARVFYAADGEEADLSTAVAQFTAVAQGFGDQVQLENTRADVRGALVARVLDGYAAGSVPYGWARVPDESTRRTLRDGRVKVKKWIRVSPDAAPIVARIFSDYADGAGIKQIAVTLPTEGVPSPGRGGWTVAIVWQILRREEYRGVILYGRRRGKRVGDRRVSLPATTPPVRVEAPHLRIVDDVTFARVRARIATRAATRPTKPAVRPRGEGPPIEILRCGGALKSHRV